MFATIPHAKVRLRNFPAALASCDKALPVMRQWTRRYHGRRLAMLSAVMTLPAMTAPAELPGMDGGLPIAEQSTPASSAHVTETLQEVVLPAPSEQPETPLLAAGTLRISGSGEDTMRAQECLSLALFYEANTEGEAGQRAVAQVILNRVAHRHYPDSVCGVVFQGSHRKTGCQFSFTCDGSLARHKPNDRSWRRVSRVAREALAGSVYQPVGLATHYHTTRINPYWAPRLHRISTVGKHRFYRKRGKGGAPSAYDFRYVGGEPLVAQWQQEPMPDANADAAQAAFDAAPDTVTEAIAADAEAFADLEAAASSEVEAIALGLTEIGSASNNSDGNLPPESDVQPEFLQSGQWLEGDETADELPAI